MSSLGAHWAGAGRLSWAMRRQPGERSVAVHMGSWRWAAQFLLPEEGQADGSRAAAFLLSSICWLKEEERLQGAIWLQQAGEIVVEAGGQLL